MSSPEALPRTPLYGRICPEYSTTKTSHAEDCVALSKALTDHWIAFMPLDMLFAKFLPGEAFPEHVSVECPDYAAIESNQGSADLRRSWAMATLRGSLPDDMTILINTSQTMKTSTAESDVAFHFHASEPPSSQPEPAHVVDGPFQFDAVDIACEFYGDDLASPFRCGENLLESIENPEGDFVRGRLASLAQKHFELQHRVSLWQIVLSRNEAHIIRWDRAGAVVSEGFNPTQDPWIFRLLWRYSLASPGQRGFDDSVRLGSGEHRALFENALRQHKTACHAAGREYFAHADLSSAIRGSQVHQIDVPDEASIIRPCLVGRQFYAAHSPIGRGTRMFVAYDLVTQQLRILKDAWRPDHEGCIPEYAAYRDIERSKVDHVPKVVCGGDVLNRPEASPQVTITQDLAIGEESASWRRPPVSEANLRKLVHYRILEDIVLPLEQLNNSRELLEAFRDIATAIQQVHDEVGLMHRDITWSNIRWTYDLESGRPRGALVDWDHAVCTDSQVNDNNPNISATWHFMPIRLMNDPRGVHTLIDDMESLYWSLLYGALHFVKHENPNILLGKNDFFGLCDGHEDDETTKMGAMAKREWLRNLGRVKSVKWASGPFSEFMQKVTKLWARFYRHIDTEAANDFGDALDPLDWQRFRAKLSGTGWFIKKINKALAKYPSGWKDDTVPDQFPKRSAKDVRDVREDLRTSRRTASLMSIDPKSRIAVAPGQSPRGSQSNMQVDLRTSVLKRKVGTIQDDEHTNIAVPSSSDLAPPPKAARMAEGLSGLGSGKKSFGRSANFVRIIPLKH
ncbi:hypothetical protein PsYK624_082030 [Phanerochaete sordida]|uniref:Fungal-type protein kinase domain-containing protein n=1 Tax=Phanerochaete sordida TaxID=48140 RepID=A0A9P3LE99_9APHY|nr:hypothetical protein PsYK624_082030 [Phanerochaete sordida]